VIGDFHCSTGSGVECYKQREIADDDHLHYASHSGGITVGTGPAHTGRMGGYAPIRGAHTPYGLLGPYAPIRPFHMGQ
jgi:hypothetical protein